MASSFVRAWLERSFHQFLDQYFEDLDLSNLRLSLFAGDVVFNHLVLRPNSIKFAGLPLIVKRGSIRELRIRVPWLHLHVEPIEMVIDTIELVVVMEHEAQPSPATSDVRPKVAMPAGQPPNADAAAQMSGVGSESWMQSLLHRALLNAAFRVRNAVVKLMDGCMVASLSFRSLDVDSADSDWNSGFVELDGASKRYALHDECAHRKVHRKVCASMALTV